MASSSGSPIIAPETGPPAGCPTPPRSPGSRLLPEVSCLRIPTRAGSLPSVVKLAIDYEHRSRLWWESGGQELWDAVTESFERGSVILDDDLAASWLAAAGAIPGWSDGPEYAPHPLAVQALAEDDPEA